MTVLSATLLLLLLLVLDPIGNIRFSSRRFPTSMRAAAGWSWPESCCSPWPR